MFESVDTRTHARTPARVPSYKLILWAFGSGELTMWLKGKTCWSGTYFLFIIFCVYPRELIQLTINTILGRNHLTKYCVCCSTWPACAHIISPPPPIPQLKHEKMAGNSVCSTLSVDSLEQFSFLTIWQPLSLWSDTNWAFHWCYAEICYQPRIACIRVYYIQKFKTLLLLSRPVWD